MNRAIYSKVKRMKTLTDNELDEFKLMLEEGISIHKIRDHFRIRRERAYQIARELGGRSNGKNKSRSRANAKLNEAQVRLLLYLRLNKKFQTKEIAEKFGVSQPTVSNIVAGRFYSDIVDDHREKNNYNKLPPGKRMRINKKHS